MRLGAVGGGIACDEAKVDLVPPGPDHMLHLDAVREVRPELDPGLVRGGRHQLGRVRDDRPSPLVRGGVRTTERLQIEDRDPLLPGRSPVDRRV